jgi:hypothetical protein
MEFEKLLSGVLRVMTPLGPRYLKPSFGQRVYLLWVFRNFTTLPIKVLSSRQQRLVESMWANNRFISFGIGAHDVPLIGTLEQRPAISSDALQTPRPDNSVADSVAPFAADARQR